MLLDKLIRRTINRNIAEHEVFLSFNNDEDAVAFQEWLQEEGLAKFDEWMDDRYEEGF